MSKCYDIQLNTFIVMTLSIHVQYATANKFLYTTVREALYHQGTCIIWDYKNCDAFTITTTMSTLGGNICKDHLWDVQHSPSVRIPICGISQNSDMGHALEFQLESSIDIVTRVVCRNSNRIMCRNSDRSYVRIPTELFVSILRKSYVGIPKHLASEFWQGMHQNSDRIVSRFWQVICWRFYTSCVRIPTDNSVRILTSDM